jgi:hypothetical protein
VSKQANPYMSCIQRKQVSQGFIFEFISGIKIRTFYKDTLYVHSSGVARVYQVWGGGEKLSANNLGCPGVCSPGKVWKF